MFITVCTVCRGEWEDPREWHAHLAACSPSKLRDVTEAFFALVEIFTRGTPLAERLAMEEEDECLTN